MRKIFIPVLFAALLMGACVEKSNLVVLDKFVPITPQNQCQVSVGSDRYYAKGYIDLAFTPRYLLAFQVTNYLSSSQTDGVGVEDAPISTAETNRFMAKTAEIEYEFDERPQADGSRLDFKNAALWGTRRVETHQVIVVDPEGGQAAAALDIFSEPQAEDLLRMVGDIDWVTSPLLVRVKILGEISDGTKVKTNTLIFSVIPSFGDSIQMGSTYSIPPGGFEDDQAHWEQMRSMCAFNNPLLNGCLVGQDYSMVNCYADLSNLPGNNEWQKYIAISRCHLQEDYDCYNPQYHVANVIEVVYNGFKKLPGDNNYYACCPSELPPEPEEEEEEE